MILGQNIFLSPKSYSKNETEKVTFCKILFFLKNPYFVKDEENSYMTHKCN